MRFEDKNAPKKRLIWGVFPTLFWFNCLLTAIFTLIVDNVFLGVAIFWPAGFFICLMYTIREIKFLPVAERREYLAEILANQAKRKLKKIKAIQGKKMKR